MNIMMPVLIVSGLGAAAGLLLSIVSILMYVPTNEKQEAVCDLLPGVNCGACGYTGCDDYAKAVVQDGERINLCIPGGTQVMQKLSELTGMEAGEIQLVNAVVKCAGSWSSTTEKMQYIGEMTCTYANQMFGGPGSCSYGCVGLGDCKAVCDYGAIEIRDGLACIDKEKCIGCSQCVHACPKSIIQLSAAGETILVACSNRDRGAEARKNCSVSCIGCMKCQLACPHDAIYVTEFLARINYDKCTACGICIEACPQNCIQLMP